jgi:hypothetical protein
MSRSYSQIETEVRDLVQDDAGHLGETQWLQAIRTATRFYSLKYPYKQEVKLNDSSSPALDGSAYDFALPSDFLDEFSVVKTVYYPADETGETELPALTEGEDWIVIEKDGSKSLRLLVGAPAASEVLRYWYTTIHTLYGGTTTIPNESGSDMVMYCAASIACFMIAAKTSKTQHPGIAADTIDYQSESERWRQLGNEYAKLSGLQDVMESQAKTSGSKTKGCVIRDYDRPPLWNRWGEYLTIGNRNR